MAAIYIAVKQKNLLNAIIAKSAKLLFWIFAKKNLNTTSVVLLVKKYSVDYLHPKSYM